jgi:hypothetical protein
LFVQFIQAPADEQEAGNRLALPVTLCVIPKADPAQLTTSAQKKRSSKNVRGLKAAGFQVTHLLSLDF